MKIRFCFLLCVICVCMGCAAVSKSVDYYSACKSDEACYAQMLANGNITKAVVKQVASQPSVADLLGQIAGFIASGLTGVLLGKKLKRC